MKYPVVIIGAGLSGLYTASLLSEKGVDCRVLEARDRIGGRALSIPHPNNSELGNFDLGATWFWPQFENTITQLIEKLNLETFVQYNKGSMLAEQTINESPRRFEIPNNSHSISMRFKDGVQSLIYAIADSLPAELIEVNKKVTKMSLVEEDHIKVEIVLSNGEREFIFASAVILALPPRIVKEHIEFSPSLPDNLISEMINKPTWMAGQAKFIAIYDEPFWREDELSGFVSSWVGPLQEIHDASPETGSGALFGFVGIPAKVRQQITKDEMTEMIVDQLIRLFGSSAQNIKEMIYKDWSEEYETAVEADWEPLRSFPQYGPLAVTEAWQKKIIFASTETDAQFGGHLEGALRSAKRAASEIIEK
ncbi:flavin monoamine oxidase family protein [Ornithinibacillus sp. 4-3]|uniref:Flavin monoamine oxidase family protein n=1 Tax=Ornithinibacillus sp. 4-3 TaxID=3231488 RepID=A0AB39HVT7_9BACI